MPPGAVATVLTLALTASCGSSQSTAELEREGSDLDVGGGVAYSSDYPTPSPVLGHSGTTVDLPPVPAFPAIDTAAPLTVEDIYSLGARLEGRVVRVVGFVLWRRDCLDEHRRRDVTADEMRAYLAANRHLCSKTELILATEPGAPDNAIRVVGGPAFLEPGVGARVMVAGTVRGNDAGEYRVELADGAAPSLQ